MNYCRYCAFCVNGDTYFCTVKEITLKESIIKKANNCSDFVLSDLGDVDSGKQYKPRKQKGKRTYKQMFLEVRKEE